MAIQSKNLKISCHARSDVGLVRENNEDAWFADEYNNFYVLCDGMGGHTAGEVASQEAVAFLSALSSEVLKKSKTHPIKNPQVIRELIQEVNAEVYRLAQKDRDLRGMGTTLCCVYVHEAKMVIGHVGDSRVYLLRDKKLLQLTEDHSLVAELLELGELNSRQARDYAHRNIITRAIGADAVVEASIYAHDLQRGDQILMCSDGLSDMLDCDEIEKILNTDLSLVSSIDRLIDTANRRGGHDNITVILLKFQDDNE